MSAYSSTRIPLDETYTALVGKAVYVFAYFEWTIIHLIEHLESGFVSKYSRGTPMTSGNVVRALQYAIRNPLVSFVKVSEAELQSCCDEFRRLTVKRNALIHAHPITDSDGSQILAYQSETSKALPDMKWPPTEIVSLIQEFDIAACRAGYLLDSLRLPQ